MNSYERTYTVTCADMDPQYRLTPFGTIVYLQDTIASYLSTWHAGAFDIIDDGLVWVVLEYQVDILDNIPIWEDTVKVRLSASEITTLKTYFDFEMIDSEGKVFSKGSSVWTIIEAESRHPYRYSLDYVHKKSQIDPAILTVKHARLRFQKGGELISTNTYKTQMTDIDFNGHVCNRTYLSVALGCLDSELLDKNFVSNVLVQYVKETYLGDVLTILCYKSSDIYLFELKNHDGQIVCNVQVQLSAKTFPKNIQKLIKRI